MPVCAILTCKARSQLVNVTTEGVSFHRFPKDPDLKSKWIELTGRQNWFPTKFSTICSRHFIDTDILVKKSGNKYLKYGAVPRQKVCRHCFVFDMPNQSTSQPVSVITSSEENELPSALEPNDVLQHIEDNDLIETNLNTSTLWERRLEEILISKESLLEQQRIQIQNLQAQNKRLKKQIYGVKHVLNDVQKMRKCFYRKMKK